MKQRIWLPLALAVLPLAGMPSAVCAQEPAKPAPAKSVEPGKIQPAKAPVKQPTQEELIQLRDAKLALPVFQKAAWSFDYDKARADAAASGKLIFAYFSRSYAH